MATPRSLAVEGNHYLKFYFLTEAALTLQGAIQNLFLELPVSPQLIPEFLSIPTGIKLSALRNRYLRRLFAAQAVSTTHPANRLLNTDSFSHFLTERQRFRITFDWKVNIFNFSFVINQNLTFRILFFGPCAIFEGKRDRNLPHFVAYVLSGPHKDDTRQRTILVFMWNDW